MEQYPPEDPSLAGISLEHLRQYTDVLLGAAELADALESSSPRAMDRHYAVSDPRVIDLVDVPAEVLPSLGDAELRVVTFHSTSHIDSKDVLHVGSSIELGFTDEKRVVLDLLSSPAKDRVLATFGRDDTSPIEITPGQLSDIVARICHPTNDPELSDFRNIDNPVLADEICDTLGANELVADSTERIYQFGDEYQVIVQRQGDRIVACEVVEFRDQDQSPLALTVEFEQFGNASKLYRSTPDGSEELILDASDFERFDEIIKHIKQRLAPDELPTNDF